MEKWEEKTAEEQYARILRYCRRHFNGSGEDVAHETFLKAHHLGYWTPLTVRQAARDLGLFRAPDLDIDDVEIPTTCGDERIFDQRERIFEAIRGASEEIRHAVTLVLDGYSFGEAAEAVGLTRFEFLRQLRAYGRGQMSLFAEVAK